MHYFALGYYSCFNMIIMITIKNVIIISIIKIITIFTMIRIKMIEKYIS